MNSSLKEVEGKKNTHREKNELSFKVYQSHVNFECLIWKMQRVKSRRREEEERLVRIERKTKKAKQHTRKKENEKKRLLPEEQTTVDYSIH